MTDHAAPRRDTRAGCQRSATSSQADVYDGRCPRCLRVAAVRDGHLRRHAGADGGDCAGSGWPGPPPDGAPTYGRIVDHLIDGELFTVDGQRWYCAAVPLFGNIAVYTSADRDPDRAPTVRVDAAPDATVRVWRRPRVLLSFDSAGRHGLRHTPAGTGGAVQLAWVGDRYVQVCRCCGALDCADHPHDPDVLRAYHDGLTA